MSLEGKGAFHFNFDDNDGDQKEEDDRCLTITEVFSLDRATWKSILDERKPPVATPNALGKFVRPGEPNFISFSSSEDYDENESQKQKTVRDLSAREVKLVPSVDSWDTEYCTLFVQFEKRLPSNSAIHSLHPCISKVFCPKWASERNGCCLEFESPESAAEALSEIEEKTVKGRPLKVDFLYNVRDRKTRPNRYFETGHGGQSHENGVGARVDVGEESASEEEEEPEYEVDYDILRELGLTLADLVQGSTSGQEELKVKQSEDQSDSKQKPSDQKAESKSSEMKEISLSVSSEEPESIEMDVQEREVLKVELKNPVLKQKKKKKKKQRFSDQKTESGGRDVTPGSKTNGLVQTSCTLESETKHTEMERSEKKKGLKRVVYGQHVESTSSVVQPRKEANDSVHILSDSIREVKSTDVKQGKKTKGFKQTVSHQRRDSQSTEVSRGKEMNSWMKRSSDLNAETERKEIKSLKQSLSGKWERKPIETERIKKRKQENGFKVVNKKLKLSDNKISNEENTEKKKKKKKKKTSQHD